MRPFDPIGRLGDRLDERSDERPGQWPAEWPAEWPDVRPGHRQRGAALLVALVMIVMISMLGISAMRGATLENRLAANSMQKETTFQSADSATDTIVNTSNVLESVICNDDDTRTLDDLNLSGGQSTSATTRYGGQTLPIGWELGGAFSAHRFVVRARSSIDAANTATDISQGVVLIGAANPGGSC